MVLSGTITSRSALAWLCPEPTANIQDYLHNTTGSKAHSCTRRINRITPIYSLSQINPLPAPRTGRTRAPAPQGTTFSLSRSSLGTENPPLAPVEDASSFSPWATVPRPVTSPAEAPSTSSAQHCVSISSSTATNPHTSEEEASSGRALLPAPLPAWHRPTQPGQVVAPELPSGCRPPLRGCAPRASLTSSVQLSQQPPQLYCSLHPPLQHYQLQPLTPSQPSCSLASLHSPRGSHQPQGPPSPPAFPSPALMTLQPQ